MLRSLAAVVVALVGAAAHAEGITRTQSMTPGTVLQPGEIIRPEGTFETMSRPPVLLQYDFEVEIVQYTCEDLVPTVLQRTSTTFFQRTTEGYHAITHRASWTAIQWKSHRDDYWVVYRLWKQEAGGRVPRVEIGTVWVGPFSVLAGGQP